MFRTEVQTCLNLSMKSWRIYLHKCVVIVMTCVSVSSAQLEGDFEEMESRLVYLETLCCQCEELSSKQHHINTLEVYQKKKRFHRLAFTFHVHTHTHTHAAGLL